MPDVEAKQTKGLSQGSRASRLTENDLQALFSPDIMGILNLDPRPR
jgi:hypothetical protein